MSDNSVSSISIVKIGSVLIFMVALALLVIWRVRQYIKKRSSKSFGEKVEKMGEIVERSSTIQKIEIKEKGPFSIFEGDEKSATIEKGKEIEETVTKSVEKTDQDSIVPVAVPQDLITARNVTKVTIETADGKQYEYESACLKATVDGKFFWSRVIDSQTKDKRYPMAGDPIIVDEIVGVIKKTSESNRVLQRVTPNTPVMFIRYEAKDGQDVKKGQMLALVGVLKEKRIIPKS